MRYIYKIIFYLQTIIPVKKILIFSSYPDYTDNSFALFDYCIKNELEYELVWLVRDGKKIEEIKTKIFEQYKKKIKVYKNKSILGIWTYLKCKHAFGSHGIYDKIKSLNYKKVNLWHGMPLKAMGNLDKRVGKEFKLNYNITIATSEFFQDIMAKSFGISKEKVFILGQPRNDLLFNKTEFFQKMNIDEKKYSKKVIWMPTFRKSLIQNQNWSNDGKYNEEKIGVVPLNQLNELNEVLREKKILLIIKLHPMDFLQNVNMKSKSNIVIIKNQDLEKIDEQLYPLLGNCDALITDFSSVWIDYEILNKPIYFVIEDYEDYKKTRGIVFDDFAEISSLPIIEKYEDFPKIIDDLLNCKIDKESSFKYNKYKDNRSCERIVKALNL